MSDPKQDLSILNDEQKAVVTYNGEKFLCVEAGPGSGKTRVLIEKVKYMINGGVEPESLLIITFSKKAAEELQERLAIGGIAKSDVQKMQISTIHSFCIKLLEDNGEVVYDVIEDEKENMFIGKHLENLGFVDEFFLPNSQIKDVIRKYHEYCTFNVDTEGLAEYIKDNRPLSREYLDFVYGYMDAHDGQFPRRQLYEKGNEELKDQWYNAKYFKIADSYEDYVDLLEREHAIDFGQMQFKALEVLKNNNATPYTNILIDEFQDTDPVQMEIFEQLMPNAKSFTVVGDINQSIYGFRGSSKNYFDYLRENYPDDFEFMYLKTNYRSTEEIIDISEDFIAHHRSDDSELGKAKCGRGEPKNNPVYYMMSQDADEEAQNILEIIRYLKNNGYNYSDIGILTRSVKGKSRCITRLIEMMDSEEEKIPYQIRGLSDLISKDEIKSVLTLMYHLVEDEDPHNPIMTGWQKDWLNLKAYTGENFNQILFDLSPQTKEILNGLQDKFEEDVLKAEKEVYFEFTNKTSRIKLFKGVFNRPDEILTEIFNRVEKPILNDENLIRYGITDPDDLRLFNELNKLKHEVTSEDIPFYERPKVSEVYLRLLTEVTGFLTEETVNALDEITNNLSLITLTLSNFEELRYERDFRGLFWFIYRTIEGRESYLPESEGVQIMTVHKSKGLEFPVTILASLDENGFPMKFKEQNPEKNYIRGVGPLYYTPREFLGYPKFDYGDKKAEDLSDEEYQLLEKQAHMKEEERIIYVAMTRAQDTLILSSIVKDSNAIMQSIINGSSSPQSVIKAPQCIDNPINMNQDYCEIIDSKNIQINKIDREEKKPEKKVISLSFTALENYNECPFKYKLANQLNFNISQKKAIDDGILIHKAFEIINKQIKANNNCYIGNDKVKEIVNGLYEKSYSKLLEENEEKYYKEVDRAINNIITFYQKLDFDFKILDSEYPFYLRDKNYALSGVIDLIYEKDGKLGIIDYKNTAIEKKYSDKHKNQLHLYVLALRDQNQKYEDKSIDKLEIYAVKSKRLVEIDFNEEIIIKLQAELERVAEDIKNGEFTSKKCENCDKCPYQNICNQKIN